MGDDKRLGQSNEFACRRLWIGSAVNLRDVGGYPVSGGGTTRWRALLRSDSLHDLATEDQAKLAAYGVRTIIDIRSLREARSAPNRLVRSSVLRYIHVPFGEARLAASTRAELYRMALHRRRRQIHTVFALFAQEAVMPAVVQCSAGTDRTGLVVAMVLALVGVAPDVIAEDYALSAGQAGAEEGISAQTMLAALQYLQTRFGGVESYLDTIGLTNRELSAIRTALLL
jgi:protein-tyrosine phosphatase